ncbi:hypothetical protein ACUOFC_23845, partial [Escherichia sp. TWPC-MK]
TRNFSRCVTGIIDAATSKPVNAEIAALQQQTADLFYENRLVPKKVDFHKTDLPFAAVRRQSRR